MAFRKMVFQLFRKLGYYCLAFYIIVVGTLSAGIALSSTINYINGGQKNLVALLVYPFIAICYAFA